MIFFRMLGFRFILCCTGINKRSAMVTLATLLTSIVSSYSAPCEITEVKSIIYSCNNYLSTIQYTILSATDNNYTDTCL